MSAEPVFMNIKAQRGRLKGFNLKGEGTLSGTACVCVAVAARPPMAVQDCPKGGVALADPQAVLLRVPSPLERICHQVQYARTNDRCTMPILNMYVLSRQPPAVILQLAPAISHPSSMIDTLVMT